MHTYIPSSNREKKGWAGANNGYIPSAMDIKQIRNEITTDDPLGSKPRDIIRLEILANGPGLFESDFAKHY